MDKRNGHKIRVFQALGGIVVLLVLGVIGWAIWSSMSSPTYTPVTVVVQAQPGGRRGAAAAAATGTTRPATQPTTQASARGRRGGGRRGGGRAAQTPMDILVAHKPRNPELEAWATAWQAGHSTAQPSDGAQTGAMTSDIEAAQLISLVEHTDLSATECLQISRLVSNGHDLRAGEVWAEPGVTRAEKELADKDHDDNSALPLMALLGQAEDPLWEAPDRTAMGSLLKRITALLMRFDRSNQWDQRPEWAMIGYGEALNMQGKYDEALAQSDKDSADAISNIHWTDDQKLGIQWLYALILTNKDQWEKAIPYLRQVASAKSNQHSRNALNLLIQTLCCLHRGTEAEAAFLEYVQRYNPDASSSASMLGIINDAKYNEEYDKLHPTIIRNEKSKS